MLDTIIHFVSPNFLFSYFAEVFHDDQNSHNQQQKLNTNMETLKNHKKILHKNENLFIWSLLGEMIIRKKYS